MWCALGCETQSLGEVHSPCKASRPRARQKPGLPSLGQGQLPMRGLRHLRHMKTQRSPSRSWLSAVERDMIRLFPLLAKSFSGTFLKTGPKRHLREVLWTMRLTARSIFRTISICCTDLGRDMRNMSLFYEYARPLPS